MICDVWFCIYEINIGMIVDVGMFLCLCKFIFEGWVWEFVYIGCCFYVDKVKEIGFVNDVYDSYEEMMMVVMNIVKEIVLKLFFVVIGFKVMMIYVRDYMIDDSLDYIVVW